jgi:transcriptional accessory protein Tex/SPT6
MGGLIHISNLSNQYVRFNSSAETLNAGGETYRIGMVLQVQVAKVDFNQRRADFMLVGGPKSVEAGTSKSTSGEEKSRKGRSREESPSRDAVQRPPREDRPSRGSNQRTPRVERPSRDSNQRPPRDEKKSAPAPFKKFERKKRK